MRRRTGYPEGLAHVRIEFWGAAGEVTGSCYVVHTPRARVMIDAGLHQGEREAFEHNQRLPRDLASIDAMVLTHAHLDHAGRLPMLPRRGYTGPVYCTAPTADLCEILLMDSARLQEADAARRARKGTAENGDAEALYTPEHVPAALALLRPTPLDVWTPIAPGVQARLVDSGHILGSASVELKVERPGGPAIRVVFSGDIGPRGMPLLMDPTIPGSDSSPPDLVVMESTYGDRDHRSLDSTIAELRGIMHEAIWAKERVLIPAFAIGRSQLAIYYLGRLASEGVTPTLPVFLDSPMAIAAMKLYHRYADQLDERMNDHTTRGRSALKYPELHLCETVEESRHLNEKDGPLAIIAGSGMCNGGRIVHHLRHHLWKRDTRVLIPGYQAANTLGRRLVSGATSVRIFGDEIPVRAKVHTVGGLSAHAGRRELIEWAGATSRGGACPIVLTHGEDPQRESLALALTQTLGAKVVRPAFGDSVEVIPRALA